MNIHLHSKTLGLLTIRDHTTVVFSSSTAGRVAKGGLSAVVSPPVHRQPAKEFSGPRYHVRFPSEGRIPTGR